MLAWTETKIIKYDCVLKPFSILYYFFFEVFYQILQLKRIFSHLIMQSKIIFELIQWRCRMKVSIFSLAQMFLLPNSMYIHYCIWINCGRSNIFIHNQWRQKRRHSLYFSKKIVSHFFHRVKFLFGNKKMINVTIEMLVYDEILIWQFY